MIENINNRKKVKRETIQGRLIYNTLEQMKDNHPSALEIYHKLKMEYPSISTATVYSHLRGLAEAGTIRVLSFLGAADRFDMVTDEHHHIKCESCGVLSNLHIKEPRDLDETAEKLSGYRIKGHHTIFYGVCPKCNASTD